MEPIESLVGQLGRWSAGRGPLYLLLAARFRQLIDDGMLAPGTLLPPDRTLAAALAVGRTTVVAAYDTLRQEGKIVRQQGSGTRVAPAILSAGSRVVGTSNPLFLHLLEPPDGVILLSCAAPDGPPPELAEAYGSIALPAADLGYHPAGYPALRAAIAARYTSRGLPTETAQIMVTTGAQQALSLLARLLIAPGDPVLVEAPTYPGALDLFREATGVLHPIAVGPSGLDVDAAARVMADHQPALAYVIPTYQNPTGTVLPPLARRRLVEAAAAADVPLVDDEALADLTLSGQPPEPLAAFGDVISVGSLSKVVWGGLRIGWIRASGPLISRLARLKAIHDLGTDVPAQLAAAALLPDLDALRDRQIARLRVGHDHLRAELAARLPSWDCPPALGGQTLWVRLPYGDGASFAQVAMRHGVAVLPGGSVDSLGGSDACLRLHFMTSRDRLTEAVRRLAAAWQAYDGTAAAAPAALNAIVV
ncbi:MAG TPA: PLP-dependent aminotransferase family protein [Streptosporangiaceae bacterium]|jgi:DNA-binding transcriptional MocR family regulator